MTIEVVQQRIIKVDGIENPHAVLRSIERCGRLAHMSEGDGSEVATDKFIRMIIRLGHESVLEHHFIRVELVCSRATSHQLVRHRLASFTQESQRYCDYSNLPLKVIEPIIDKKWTRGFSERLKVWREHMENSHQVYCNLIASGASAQEARHVLPSSVATRLAMTANLREWRHILRMRCARGADPPTRALMQELQLILTTALPTIFDDIPVLIE